METNDSITVPLPIPLELAESHADLYLIAANALALLEYYGLGEPKEAGFYPHLKGGTLDGNLAWYRRSLAIAKEVGLNIHAKD